MIDERIMEPGSARVTGSQADDEASSMPSSMRVAREGAGAFRRSVATRERREKSALLRLTLGPDRRPFIDLLGRAPGRGVYVEPDRAILEETLSPKGLERTFKGAAQPLEAAEIEQLVEDTITRIEDRILDLVTLARRAGRLEMGMDCVLRARDRDAGRETGLVIIMARDLAERSSATLRQDPRQDAAGHGQASEPGHPDHATRPSKGTFILVSTKAEIGARLGRDELGVVAIHPSVLAERVVLEAARRDGLLSSSTNAASRGRVRSARKRKHD